MQRGIVLTDPIYDRMITELYTGNYARGSSLPTLEELCSLHHVGRNTMRMVLSRLAENGYIRSSRGRAAEVVFDLQNPGHRAQYLRDLLLRREAILDVFDTLALLLPFRPGPLSPCLPGRGAVRSFPPGGRLFGGARRNRAFFLFRYADSALRRIFLLAGESLYRRSLHLSLCSIPSVSPWPLIPMACNMTSSAPPLRASSGGFWTLPPGAMPPVSAEL